MVSKKIPLSQGQVALVDVEDYEYLNQWKWYARKKRYTFYAARNERKEGNKQTTVLMPRIIMKPSKGMQIDHRNGNGLDNRKENLRICNNSQNQINRGAQKNNTSGYKGVSWNDRDKIWVSQIKINGEKKHIGYHSTKEEAALAYNEAAKKYHGEFARLNIIK